MRRSCSTRVSACSTSTSTETSISCTTTASSPVCSATSAGRSTTASIVDPTQGGSTFGFGLNVCDVNGDGFEDLLVANNDRNAGNTGYPRLLLNVGGTLVRTSFGLGAARYNDLMACADVDGSGLPDVVGRWSATVVTTPGGEPNQIGGYRSYRNQGTAEPTIRLRVLGATGARNQQGRLVRVRPMNAPDKTLLRVVESGSGLQAQNGYDLLFAAPWPGPYEVSVRFADGWVETTANPGDALTIRADGAVVPGLH